jgi:hypothetical protein
VIHHHKKITLMKIKNISVGVFFLILGVTLLYLLLPPTFQPQYLNIIGISIIVICYLIIIIDIIFLLPTVHGAIYLPSSDTHIKTMLDLAQIKKGDTAVDIGSGDGRIVAALSQAGAEAHGYEINPFLVLWSKFKLSNQQLSTPAHIHWASMWSVNYKDYSVVILFGMSYIMKGMQKKLQKELPVGSRIICNSFPFPNWKETKRIGNVYLYVKGK